MSLVIPPGYGSAAFVLNGAAGTPNFVTTIGVRFPLNGTNYDLYANQLFNAYAENLMTRTWSGLTLQSVQLTVGSITGNGSVSSTEDPVAGSLSGADAALAMSVIARKLTSTLGRKGRGRMFLPGLLANEDVNPNGDMGGATRDAIQADVTNFFNDIENGDLGANLGPRLLHNDESAGVLPEPTPITALVVDAKVGWVRKRIR